MDKVEQMARELLDAESAFVWPARQYSAAVRAIAAALREQAGAAPDARWIDDLHEKWMFDGDHRTFGQVLHDAIFAAAPSPPVEQAAGGGVDDAMVERVAIAIYAAKRGFSMAIARDRWANVEQKSRFIGPARDALMGG